jgi:septal ring factor EnvC (AmiA/AmiB activator)
MRRVALLIVVLFAAGCGGGGPSRAEFASKGNAICQQMTRDLGALHPPQVDPTATGAEAERQQKELQAYARRAEEITRDATDRLGKLDPPSDLKATRDEWRHTIEVLQANTSRLTRLYNKAVQAQQSGDEAAAGQARNQYGSAARFQSATGKRSAALVRRLGWTACA